MKKIYYSLAVIAMLFLGQSVIGIGGVQDYCTKDDKVVNNGHCTTTEGFPAEEGEGTVVEKRCEYIAESPNPPVANCSGNALNPKPI